MKKNLLFLGAALIMGASTMNAATVYFENTLDWNPVYVWQWGGADATNSGSWPGKTTLQDKATVVQKDGHSYFKWDTQCTSIIFTNGSGAQTPDLVVTDNMIYNCSGATGQSFQGGTIDVPQEAYLVGGMNGWTGYDADYKFTDEGNGMFTFSIPSLSGEFKIVTNDGWLGYPDAPLQSGNEYTLYDSGMQNCKLASDPAKNVKFKYNYNTKVLVVTYEGTDDPNPPTPGDYTGWYLNVQGDFNNWEPEGVALAADGTATAKNLAIGTSEFELKIWDGSGDKYYIAEGGVITPGTEVKAVIGNGARMTIADATASSVYDVWYNAATGMMKVTLVSGGGDDPNPPTPPTPGDYTGWYLNVQGDFNNWQPEGVALNADGTATAKNLAIGTSEFELKIWDGMIDKYYIAEGGVITPGTEVKAVIGNGAHMTIADATASSVYDVWYNAATGMMKVTPVVSEPTDYTTWYVNIVGSFNNWTVEGEGSVSTQPNEEGVATFTSVPIGTKTFKVKTWDGSIDGYFIGPEVLDLDQTYTLGNDEYDSPGMTIADAIEGELFNMTYNCKTKELKVSKAGGSSVNEIEVADENAVYYNLQGVKVANPEKGIFVKVAGNKVSKVIR